MLTTGTKGKAEVKVDDTNTAVTMGSGSLKVFATPAMIALIEKAACKALEGHSVAATSKDRARYFSWSLYAPIPNSIPSN